MEELINTIKNLEAEGMVKIIYDEEYPGDIIHARVRLTTEEERQQELDSILQN